MRELHTFDRLQFTSLLLTVRGVVWNWEGCFVRQDYEYDFNTTSEMYFGGEFITCNKQYRCCLFGHIFEDT